MDVCWFPHWPWVRELKCHILALVNGSTAFEFVLVVVVACMVASLSLSCW